jgi:hypothetical protein
MTTFELVELVNWIEDRYGKNPRWSRPERIIDEFATYTLGAGLEAAMDLYREGRPRINPSDLIGPTQRTWRARVDAGIDPRPEVRECRRHIWSLPNLDEMTWVFAGQSMAYDECTICGETRPTGAKGRQPVEMKETER